MRLWRENVCTCVLYAVWFKWYKAKVSIGLCVMWWFLFIKMFIFPRILWKINSNLNISRNGRTAPLISQDCFIDNIRLQTPYDSLAIVNIMRKLLFECCKSIFNGNHSAIKFRWCAVKSLKNIFTDFLHQ